MFQYYWIYEGRLFILMKIKMLKIDSAKIKYALNALSALS